MTQRWLRVIGTSVKWVGSTKGTNNMIAENFPNAVIPQFLNASFGSNLVGKQEFSKIFVPFTNCLRWQTDPVHLPYTNTDAAISKIIKWIKFVNFSTTVVLEKLARAIRQGKEVKEIYIGGKEIKLFVDNMILYIGNLKNLPKDSK